MKEKIYILINKFINKETILYIIFGVLTTVVDSIVFYIVNKLFEGKYIFATVIAWFIAVLFAYLTNKRYVFESKVNKFKFIIREIWLFFFARVVSLGFTLIWMYISVEMLFIDEFISKLLANIFVVIMNYLFSKAIIFNKK